MAPRSFLLAAALVLVAGTARAGWERSRNGIGQDEGRGCTIVW